MSINKFQERIFRTGCGTAVLFVCAGVFFAGMFYMGCGMGARTSGANQDQEKKVAVTIGDSPLYAEDLSKMIEANRQRALQGVTEGGPDALPPAQEAYVQGQTINQALEGVGFTYLAKKAGATFTDEAIKKAEMATFEHEVIQTKFALQSQ